MTPLIENFTNRYAHVLVDTNVFGGIPQHHDDHLSISQIRQVESIAQQYRKLLQTPNIYITEGVNEELSSLETILEGQATDNTKLARKLRNTLQEQHTRPERMQATTRVSTAISKARNAAQKSILPTDKETQALQAELRKYAAENITFDRSNDKKPPSEHDYELIARTIQTYNDTGSTALISQDHNLRTLATAYIYEKLDTKPYASMQQGIAVVDNTFFDTT